MTKSIKITTLKKQSKASIQIPGSKSYTNRAFLLAALAKGKSKLIKPLLSDDTKYMIKALKKLGVKIEKKGTNFTVHGTNGKFKKPNHEPISLFLGNAGTATRFLTAAMSLQNFKSKITGNKRMRERPIQDLINGLNQLGATAYSQKKNKCPPVMIDKPIKGGTCKILGNLSSQYFSALLISTPLCKKNVKINVIGDLVSKPYIDQTIDIIETFGCKVKNDTYKNFEIKGRQSYKAQNYEIEADASSATYFAAIAAVTNSEITIENLNPNSVQADINMLKILKNMGCKILTDGKGITIIGAKKLKPLGKIDLNHMPDGAMTVAIVCALTKGKSRLTGLHNLRIKETDRLKALCTELNKINCKCKESSDSLIIDGNPETLKGSTINTYDDHRMAMCFAVAGTIISGIKIKDPDCVNKTYPNFWKDLKKITKSQS